MAGLVGVGVVGVASGKIKGANISCTANTHKHTHVPVWRLWTLKRRGGFTIHTPLLKLSPENVSALTHKQAHTHTHKHNPIGDKEKDKGSVSTLKRDTQVETLVG